LTAILTAAASGAGESTYKEKLGQLNEMIEDLRKGPLRSGTFLRMLDLPGGGAVDRARVIFEDGTSALVPVPEKPLAESLRRGEGHGPRWRGSGAARRGRRSRLRAAPERWPHRGHDARSGPARPERLGEARREDRRGRGEARREPPRLRETHDGLRGAAVRRG